MSLYASVHVFAHVSVCKAMWITNHEGSPSCCTLEGEWENRKWVQESRFPRWRKVWWPRWTNRTVERTHRAVCGREAGLHLVRGWKRWGTWWPADLKDPAESDSWSESPRWPWPLHTTPPLAPPPPVGHWVSPLQRWVRWLQRSGLDWKGWASMETSSQQCSQCRWAEWRRRLEILGTPVIQTRFMKGACA